MVSLQVNDQWGGRFTQRSQKGLLLPDTEPFCTISGNLQWEPQGSLLQCRACVALRRSWELAPQILFPIIFHAKVGLQTVNRITLKTITKMLRDLNFYFFQRFFFMWTIFKAFVEFVTLLFLIYILGFFGHETCRIWAPQPGIKPALLALEAEVLTSGPPGKSLDFSVWNLQMVEVFLILTMTVITQTHKIA